MNKKLRFVLFSFVLCGIYTYVMAQNVVDPPTTNPQKGPDSLSSNVAVSPEDTALPVDGYYRSNALANAKPFPYPKVNMNNVRFYKRIWRDIDLTDPKNKIFATPGANLMDAIMEGISERKITAYDPTSTKDNPTGDAFVTRLTPVQALARLTDSVLVPQFDSEGNQIGATMKLNDFNSESITKFRIKEDIFYDKQRSRVETRIIGIAPLIKIKAAEEVVSEQPAFWLYFPQCRKVFVTKEVIDPLHSIYNISFDDIFIEHAFNSKIVKESNPADLSLKDYAPNKEELEQSNEIEQQITQYKKHVWHY